MKKYLIIITVHMLLFSSFATFGEDEIVMMNEIVKNRKNAYKCLFENEVGFILSSLKANNYEKSDVLAFLKQDSPPQLHSSVDVVADYVFSNNLIKHGMSQADFTMELNKIFKSCITRNGLIRYEEELIKCKELSILSVNIFNNKEKGIPSEEVKIKFQKSFENETAADRLIDDIYKSDLSKGDYKRKIWAGCALTL